jgi:hypothetical protein
MPYATHDPHRFSIQLLRDEYQRQPPKLQQETRERARLRRQNVPSYLMRHAGEIYQP